MKKFFHRCRRCPLSPLLFSWAVLLCLACDPYTVENDYAERISAGSVVIMPSQCVELFHFPLVGDFPLQFRYADRNLISQEDQSPGHYLISSEGEVLKREQPCAKNFSVLNPVSEPVSLESEEDIHEKPPQNFIILIHPVFELNSSKPIEPPEEEAKNQTSSKNQAAQYRSPHFLLRQNQPILPTTRAQASCQRRNLKAQSLKNQSSCSEAQNTEPPDLEYKYNFH